jgi:hypothetical protein
MSDDQLEYENDGEIPLIPPLSKGEVSLIGARPGDMELIGKVLSSG